ncbi:MAG: ATP synthase F1 subunit epsilon [Planctomycetota bacterium]|jgi:F-type H+-transporting ATPase subunit epsilon|nr:ATP synthase F1 subunit epsilon [Planctomycetota bacterium]
MPEAVAERKIPGTGDLVCRVITPERMVYERRVSAVTLYTLAGTLEVYARHEPTIAPLAIGVMSIRDADGSEQRIAIHGGFMDMNANTLGILADAAELEDEVDRDRASTSLTRAEELLATLTNDDRPGQPVDIDRARLAVARALLRLRVSGDNPANPSAKQ